MRIISPFRDYYDTAQGFGADQTRVFVRKPKIHAVKPSDLPSVLRDLFREARGHGDHTQVYSVIPIVFCGRLYHAVRVTHRVRDRSSLLGRQETIVHYDLEVARNWAAANGLAAVERGMEARLRDGRVATGTSQGRPVDGAARDWLIENRAAILVGDEADYSGFLTENSPLAPLQFYRIFAAPQAYQELDMFLSGVLSAEDRPMLPISDEIRAQQHGFDRLSFRRAPTKRRG